MVADVPVGAFLSGGIDSSLVVALMQAQCSRPVRTFSIGFDEGDYNEAHHAKAVAEHLGTDHTELYVRPEEARAVIPLLPGIYDEPFSDSSQIPTYLVSKLARKDVTVALSGDGGDEGFGGYNRYTTGTQLLARTRRVPVPMRSFAASAIRSCSPSAWDRAIGVVDPVIPKRFKNLVTGERLHKLAGLLTANGVEQFYHRTISHWPDPGALLKNGREPLTMLLDPSQWPALEAPAETMMFLDLVSYLVDDILVKVDRATMAVSLEGRAPLLDHRLLEFAWTLPISMKIRGGQGKVILRRLLDTYVPRELIERPKQGFGVPIGDWLRGPLRDWAEDLLDSRRMEAEGFFHPGQVQAKWRAHLSGNRNWQFDLWDILMFQAWLRLQRSAPTL
jgi:asparagine synthase (glutamine-hydrolysing)